MARRFNTAGPCRPDWHYMIPAERRLPEAPGLVEQRACFVVHAPRQTGKTTALRALAEQLTASGRWAALHFSCEAGEAAGDDYGAAERILLSSIRTRAELTLPPALHPPDFPAAPEGNRVEVALRAWARACPRPLALFFDEIDALRDQSLLSVLRQLRAGFPIAPAIFPPRWRSAACATCASTRRREGEKDPTPKGLEQLDGYLAQLGLDEGVLVLFDRRAAAGDVEARTRLDEARTPSGRRVALLRA
ncbi:hypothetical protein WMF20_37815 [Sorangium sp. So ce834]|uniref:hypothetical protein n=1 Tax=Sorangium sp. So ce834 TaxID=3133321 RepID=UPI003F617569